MSGRGFLGPLLVGAFAAFGTVLALAPPASPPIAVVSPGGSSAGSSGSGRTPGEEQAVSASIVSGLRPATDDDAADSESREDLRVLYGDYRPYFVRGDFDSDGRLDFAQAYVRRDGPEPLFDVAVFFGSAEGFTAPVWVERGLLLSEGDLTVDRSVLIVTEDVERDVFRRWRWQASEGRFLDVDAGSEGDDVEPWTEPDSRLGKTA